MITPADAETFSRCIAVGGVAVFPADTVYGLACEPDNREAVDRLYLLKRRRPEKPAAVMFFDRELALAALPELGPRTRAALEALLPGAVTLLLPNPGRALPARLRAGPETLGLRVPAWPTALASLAAVALAGAAVQRERRRRPGRPHARRRPRAHPRAPPTSSSTAAPLPGTPSTVIDLRRWERDGTWSIARAGAVAEDAVARALSG